MYEEATSLPRRHSFLENNKIQNHDEESGIAFEQTEQN
jgi:hypothetical protein